MVGSFVFTTVSESHHQSRRTPRLRGHGRDGRIHARWPVSAGRSVSRSASDRPGGYLVFPENAGLEHRARAGGTCIGRARPHRRGSPRGRRRFSRQTRSGRYSWARYYHPTLQRFLSEGPIGFGGGDPNLYAYVGNMPTVYGDPLGLFADVLLDVGFIAYDLGRLVLGGRKELAENFTALSLDVVGAVVPFATGLGPTYRTARAGVKIGWSSGSVQKAAKALEAGATEARVGSRSKAAELFLRRYQGAGYRTRLGCLRARPSLPSMRTDPLSRHFCLSSVLLASLPMIVRDARAGAARAPQVPSQDSTIHLFAHASA
jgi:RHS repeat-associated protein